MQQVEFLKWKTSRVWCEDMTSFKFRADRKLPWLQKVCFYILRKLEAYSVGEKVTVERHTIDEKSFINRLFEQQGGIEEYFNKRPTMILVGAEDYSAMMNEAVATQMFSYNAKYGYNREIMGLRVHVIPWMRGVLVMPDLEKTE